MTEPKQRLVKFVCVFYAMVAAAGLYVAVLGQVKKPEPLQLVEETGRQSALVEQARHTLDQAREQQPNSVVLSEFYRVWLLESDYEYLATFTEPMYEGDSFVRRLVAYNSTVADVDDIYQDAVLAMSILSSGSLILVLLMLWAPTYFLAALVASYPVVFVFLCAFLGINHDPVFSYWAPFPVLGAIVFVLQLTFSIRYGRPEHRNAEGMQNLLAYRRGLVMMNLGLFMLIVALLMFSGTLSGPVRSLRALRGLMIFGEGGIVLIGILGGALLIALGVREMNRKSQGQVDSTSS